MREAGWREIMIYKRLGRTGLEISRLGFGAMRLAGDTAGQPDPEAAVPVIHRAFELGVNYIDTAVMYCQYQSERIVGQALKGWRDRVYVSTKNHYTGSDEKAWWRNLENSLERLDVDYIDVYNIHAISLKTWEENVSGPNQVLSWMRKAHDQGLIRNICASFHDTAEAFEAILDADVFASFTVQYNVLDQSLEPVFEKVAANDVGLVVMGPVGGGRLGGDSETLRNMIPGARSVPEVALRFVLANPHVTCAISGMSSIEMVEENAAVAARPDPLSESEHEAMRTTLERFKGLSELYCTGCSYCMPCPHGVDIPAVFSMVNIDRVYGLKQHAQARYEALAGKPTYCVACGSCEPKCPQQIPIRHQLREACARFDAAYGGLDVRLQPVACDAGGIQVHLAVHNLGEAPNQGVIHLSADAGLAFSPSRFEASIRGPFLLQREKTVLRGPFRESRRVAVTVTAHDAFGERRSECVLALGRCRRVDSMEAFVSTNDDLSALVLDGAGGGPVVAQGLRRPEGGRAWAAFTDETLLLRAQLRTDVPDSACQVILLLDLRNRRGNLPPGFHEHMYGLRVTGDSDGYQAHVVQGALDPARVEVCGQVLPRGVDVRIAIPWKSVADYAPKLGAGFGLDIIGAILDANREPLARSSWSDAPGTPRDGVGLGTVFFSA